MSKKPTKITISTEDLKQMLDETPFYTFFKDRLYIYEKDKKSIAGYMLKDDFDVKKIFKKKDDEAAEAFANIELQFNDKESEEDFDYDMFVDTVLSELEVWLSYDSTLED